MGAETAADRAGDTAGEASGATDANVTETGQRPEVREQRSEVGKATPSRLSSVLSMMEDVPAEVREEIQSKDQAKSHEQRTNSGRSESRRGEESSQGESRGAETGGAEAREADEAGDGAGASRRDDESAEGAGEKSEVGPSRTGGKESKEETPDDDHVADDWPDSARQRVSKLKSKRDEYKTRAETEAEKRTAAERERDDARAGQAELKQRLENTRPVQMAPSAQDPLADVEDEAGLQKAVADYEALLEFAEMNRDGKEGVVIGKDAAGNPTTRDYGPEDMARIRIEAEKALRKHVPAKAAYLQDRKASDAAAREVYPELFDTGSEDYQLARSLVQQVPELMRFGHAWLNVGRFLRGYKAEQQEMAARKNGRIPVKEHARGNGNGRQAGAPALQENGRSKIEAFTRPQPPIAPSTPKVRGGSAAPVTMDGEIKAARERLADEDSDEALEQLVNARRAIGRQRGGRQPTLT